MRDTQKKTQENPLPVLIKNAYDFLESALEKLENDTKGSVINFYSAVELFLKAPLLHEHWTLIVSKDPQLPKFQEGDFVSVNFEESIRRLKNVLGIEITNEAYNAFNKVRQHRNKYVHFFINNEEELIAQIALEQLSAWAHLHNLIKNQFFHIFCRYEAQSQRIESSLKRHRDFWHEYAQLEYERLKEYFTDKINKGFIVTECPTCSVQSLVETIYEGIYTELHCRICRSYSQELEITCPSCQQQAILRDDGYGYCEHCEHSFEPDEIFRILNTYKESKRLSDPIEELIPAHCHYCEGYQTVCELNQHYLCTNCFILTSTVGYCEYCSNATNMSDTSDSYAFGCGFCGGAIGND